MQGLRNLLRHLGARPGGATHLVVSDLREELVIYINGWPYLRRELEMPAAALHHAGVLPVAAGRRRSLGFDCRRHVQALSAWLKRRRLAAAQLAAALSTRWSTRCVG